MSTGREIDSDVRGSTKVDPYRFLEPDGSVEPDRGAANQKPISNECGHTTRGDLQSARPRKQAGSRTPAPEQCRNFV